MKRKLFKSILTLVAITTMTLTSYANGTAKKGAAIGKWTQDYKAALELASKKNLPVMLMFTGSDWCGWCKLMDRNVFSADEFKNFASKNLILVALDFPNDKSIVPEEYVKRNYALQNKYGVRGYPTYIVLKSDGQTVLGRLRAGKEKTASSFISEIQTLLN